MAIDWLLATPDTDSEPNGSGVTTLTAPKPTGLANGHIWVVFIALSEDATDRTITKPASFTLEQRSDRANVVAGAVYYKVITNAAGEPASYDWTISGGASWTLYSNALTGVDTSTPVDVSGVTNNSSAGGLVAPSVAPTSTDGFLTCWYAIDQNAAASAVQPIGPGGSGLTEEFELSSGSNTNDTVGYAGYVQLSASGATGTKTVTPTNSAANATISVVWKTASGSTPANLTVTANGASTATISLRSRHLFSVTANGASTATIALRSPHRFAVTANGASSVTITLSSPAHLTVTANGASSVAAEVITRPTFAPTIAATSSLSATVISRTLLTVTANGTSGLSLTLRSPARMTITANGASSVTATVTAAAVVPQRGPVIVAVLAMAHGTIRIRPVRGGATMSTQHGTRWDINDKPRLQYTVTDENNSVTDPSTINLRVTKPDGTSTDYSYAAETLTKDSTGIYYVEVVMDQVGDWNIRWETTAPQTAEEGSFIVRRNKVAKIN